MFAEFQLAENLNMTVGRLRREMDMPEFVQWIAFARYREEVREQDSNKAQVNAEVKAAMR